jgi:hypothetical protein
MSPDFTSAIIGTQCDTHHCLAHLHSVRPADANAHDCFTLFATDHRLAHLQSVKPADANAHDCFTLRDAIDRDRRSKSGLAGELPRTLEAFASGMSRTLGGPAPRR